MEWIKACEIFRKYTGNELASFLNKPHDRTPFDAFYTFDEEVVHKIKMIVGPHGPTILAAHKARHENTSEANGKNDNSKNQI